MSSTLRVVLIIASFATAYWSFRKIRKSQIQIEDSIFWIIAAIVLMIISVFPGIPSICAKILGIQSASNFVFLCMIFILIIKTFMLTIRISQTDNKIKSLVQEVAIRDKKIEDLISCENNEKRA